MSNSLGWLLASPDPLFSHVQNGGMAAITNFLTSIKSCCQNQISGQESTVSCINITVTSSSSSLVFSRYARSCQDQWPEPRVYDDVPYEKMQVWSLGSLGDMAKATY